MAKGKKQEGLVLTFGYDLTSGMDEGLKDFYAAMNRLQQAAKSRQIKVRVDWSGNQKDFNETHKLITKTISLIKTAGDMMRKAGGDASQMSASEKTAYDAIQVAIQKNLAQIDAFTKKINGLPLDMQTSVAAMRRQLSSLSSQWDEMSVGEKFSGKGFSRMSAEAKRLLKDYISLQKQMERHGVSIDRVAQLDREKSLLRRKNLTTEAEYLEKIRILEERIATTKIGSPKYEKYKKDLREVSAQLDVIHGKQKKANTSLALTEMQMKRLNDSFRLADHYTGRLLIRLAAYAGAAMFVRMLRNIKDITAEFELQEVALGAIIQDTSKANKLFEQIKAQAVRSPFEVKELVTYTKQLAAYRVETERLFDVTMQLADISSALGVDMQRLILAYGQVKAASVLRGQELRQFTEAGIPLVQKLADKFTELRGRVVSTGEVFELISRRAVSFKMIEQIFNDMTEAGGEFYKMQEKQAETLKGRWTNLKDAISIAYDEIGRTKGVQKLMDGIISGTSSLVKNWRTWSVIIGTVAKSMIALAIASRNTRTAMSALTGAELSQAIAEKKLTLSSGERLKVWQAEARLEVIRHNNLRRSAILTRKAAMENNVLTASALKLRAAYERLSVTFSTANRDLRYIKGMRAADALMLKAARSTNLFSASMYRLSAAIKRLWVSIGPAGWIIIALTAILNLVRKINESANDFSKFAENAEKAVASYETFTKRAESLDKLATTYQTLATKTERTDAESKKLNATVKALTDAYPQLSKVMKEYGDDVEKIIEKLNKLNEQEKQKRLDILIATRDATVKALAKAKKEYDRYSTINTELYPGYVGKAIYKKGIRAKFVDIEEMNDAANEVDNLTEQLESLNEVIAGMNKKPDLGIQWDGWRKKVLEFKKAVKGTDTPIQAVYEDELEQITGLTEVWDKSAKAWKEEMEKIAQYDKALKEKLPEDERQQIIDAKEYSQAIADVNYELLKYYNQLDLLAEKGGGKTKIDTSMFKDELDLVKRIYKKYVDLRKLQSESEARESIANAYGNLTVIDFLNPRDLAKRIADIRARAIAFAANTADEDVKKAIQDFVDTADEEIDNVSYTELENAIKTRLDNLAKDLSTAKEANKFYDEIFGKTFDRGLAEAFTSSIYGADRTSARNALKTYVSEVFGSDVADLAFQNALMPDWGMLEEIFKQRADVMSESQKKSAEDIISSGRKTSEEQFRVWVNDLAKEKDVLDKRIDLHRQTVQRIREIEGESDANLDPTKKAELVSQYRKREQRLASDIAYQAFKESPVYTQLFANLDNASVQMLKRLRGNIEGLKAEWKNDLDPSNLKELQSRIENIDKLLVQKRPFETLTKSLKEYWKNADKRKSAEKNALSSAKAAKEQLAVALKYDSQLEDAEQTLRDMQEGRITASEDEKVAQQQKVDILRQQARAEKELYDTAKKRADSDAEDADHWREINELIVESANVILGYQEQLTQMNELIFKIAAAWQHADDIQKEYLNNLKEGINEMIGGVAELGKGILEIKGGNYFEGIVDVLVGLERTIEGVLNTTNAQRLREINRELEAQDEAIKNLEKAYDDLRYAEDKVFGTEWVTNRKREIDVLEAKAAAYEKKAEEEMKKRDKDRNEQQAEQYLDEADAIRKEISRREHEISEKMVGTDAASAAREFASAWLEAYKSYGNTLDAMDEKFQDLIENMVKESLMARVIKDNIIDPIMTMFDQLDETANKEDYIKALQSSLEYYEGAKGKVNDIMMALQEVLRQYGIDFQSTASGLHGISKDIAQASESSILGLAAGINTQNYYISSIYGSVTQIVELLQSGSSRYAPARGEGGAATGDYSNYLSAIQGHTSSMANDLSAIRQALAGLVVLKGNAKALNVKQ